MQDLHGDQWEEKLNMRQRHLLGAKKYNRAEFQAYNMWRPLMRPARDDEYSAAWHRNVKSWKTFLLKQEAREKAIRERRSKRNSSDVRLES